METSVVYGRSAGTFRHHVLMLYCLYKWIIVFATLSYDFKLIKKSLAEQLEQLPESDSRLENSEK